MSIELEGLEGLESALNGFTKGDKLEEAMQKAVALVEADAKRKAPKDTGALRRSISSKVENDNGDIKGIVFTPLEYAPYVEYGTGLFAEETGRATPWAYEDEETGELIVTRGQKPQPYMRPALNDNREEIIRILKGGLIND